MMFPSDKSPFKNTPAIILDADSRFVERQFHNAVDYHGNWPKSGEFPTKTGWRIEHANE